MTYKNVSDLTLDDLNGESLEHYGIPGQKWGVRRYQNEDGSLTSAGKRRYGSKDGTSIRKTKRYARDVEKELNELDERRAYEKKLMQDQRYTHEDMEAFREWGEKRLQNTLDNAGKYHIKVETEYKNRYGIPKQLKALGTTFGILLPWPVGVAELVDLATANKYPGTKYKARPSEHD